MIQHQGQGVLCQRLSSYFILKTFFLKLLLRSRCSVRPRSDYASRRSLTSKADSECVCVYVHSSCNCSTVAGQRKLTASSHVLLDFDSWICKVKLCSRVMATFTYSEGCCCFFRTLCSFFIIIIMSTQTFYSTYELALHRSACYFLATRVREVLQSCTLVDRKC